MTEKHIQADVVIVGAGIAGLWLHNRLNQLGYHALLLEKGKIGQAQTLSAQGIIHGGSKYALNGILSNAAQAISAMPTRWQACLSGQGEIDLSQVKINTNHQLLWSTNSLSSKMVSFFASKALQSRMQAVPKSARQGLFADPSFQGSLYELDEPVLDVHSVLTQLTQTYPERILQLPDGEMYCDFEKVRLQSIHYGDVQISAQQFVFTAGEGMADILSALGLKKPKMQLRPLQMLLCKAKNPETPLPKIYAHSLGSGSKPIATISSHSDKDGNIVWYLGGNIAEEGVGKPTNVLIKEAQALLSQILPWYSPPELIWATHNVNRAEPKQSGFARPDSAFVSSHENVHIGWPTKLALAPDLSDKVIAALETQNLQKNAPQNTDALPRAEIAEPLWDRAFQ
ncbi:FAD-dependent oxidoreductase [Methylophaga sp. OBS3]|uniref:FAD-dependent oxidoreductase n=1 Tax=Methylophaga sp. OBS3 TaxID=2991934 RepID=UPI002254D801|nr:FAD-dependent oxidoreductase [Methylophaga sp. OBS3]MCX4190755.1 FAD-dependent oxidoreductase [Methylophaga sp. OBS3]